MASIDFAPSLRAGEESDEAGSPARKKQKMERQSDIVALLGLAHKYEVRSLADDLESRIQVLLNDENALEFLYFAGLYDYKSLELKISKFIMASSSRLREMRKSEFFSKLSRESVVALLDGHSHESDSDGDLSDANSCFSPGESEATDDEN